MSTTAIGNTTALNNGFSNIVQFQRFSTNPMITTASSTTLGKNINGPSLIRVPDWVSTPLGRYYMYFAHHTGTYIRLAYADDLQGPWKIYNPGTLHLTSAETFYGHIGSPDVHIDDKAKLILMYFHGPARTKQGQWTGVASSKDGINFNAHNDLLGKFYFRVWKFHDFWYSIAKNNNEGWGELYRASSPFGPFKLRGNFLQGMRHAAVLVVKHTLLIFYSRVGDAPERILLSKIDMSSDWMTWSPTAPTDVLRPEYSYEGIQHPVKASIHGTAMDVQELRDPYVLIENDRLVIFYTGAGEKCICAAWQQYIRANHK